MHDWLRYDVSDVDVSVRRGCLQLSGANILLSPTPHLSHCIVPVVPSQSNTSIDVSSVLPYFPHSLPSPIALPPFMAGEAESEATAALSASADVAASPTPQSPYRGQPLEPGEIRLLTVDAITSTDNITSTSGATAVESAEVTLRLRTTRHKLEDNPEFDAISYVWGIAPASVSVQCNGARLLVTPTAYEMLEHLRLYKPNPHRPFWIDAICINQDDADEKSHQVQRMSKVYSHATSVVVWMGPSNPWIRTFMEDFPRVLELASNWSPTRRSWDPLWRGEDWPDDHADFWVGMYCLLHHDWFRRLWTYQEVVLAQKAVIMCGSLCIDAIAFFTFVENGYYEINGYMLYDPNWASRVPTKPTQSSLAFTACSSIIWARSHVGHNKYGLKAAAIPGLIYSLRHLRVKELIDKIWAISGLLNEDLQNKLAPMVDYSDQSRKEYWKTYINFTKTVIEAGQSLNLLRMPPSIAKHDLDMPSWCPDVSSRLACLNILHGDWNIPIIKQASWIALLLSDEDDEEKSYERRVAVVDHPLKAISIIEFDKVLCTRGFVLDSISEVVEDPLLLGSEDYMFHAVWDELTMDNPIHAAAMGVLSRALSLACRTSHGGENHSILPLHFLMCICCDYRIIKEMERAYTDAWNSLKVGGRDYFNSLEGIRQDQTWSCIVFLQRTTGHSFFATEGGRFGIAHPGCKPGDKVCTFYGGEPLYILRWPTVEDASGVEHSDEYATYCAAFIPHLMEQHERDAARLGPDEMFKIK